MSTGRGLHARNNTETTALFDTLKALSKREAEGFVTCLKAGGSLRPLGSVRAGIGRLDTVADHVHQGRLDHLPGMVRLQPFGILVTVTVLVQAGMNWSKKQVHPDGRGMIDDFRLWGSRPCRRKGGPSTQGEWLTSVAHQVAHAFDHHNASLSEGAPSLLWTGPCLERLVGGGFARIPRVGCVKAKGGCASCFRASPGAPHERGAGGESDPHFFGADAPPGRGKWPTLKATIYPPLRGGRSHHSDPWREGRNAESPAWGCPAQPSLDGHWSSNLVLALASPERGCPARPGTANRSLQACTLCRRPYHRADGVRTTATGSL